MIGNPVPSGQLPLCLKKVTHSLSEMAAEPPVYIYFLLRGDVLIYVGQTMNLERRMGDHRAKGKQFDRVFFTLVPRSEADMAESRYITRLKPTENLRDSCGATRRGTRRITVSKDIIPPADGSEEAIAFANYMNDPALQRTSRVREFRREWERLNRGGA